MYNECQDSSDTSLVQWSIDRFTTKGKSGYLLQQYVCGARSGHTHITNWFHHIHHVTVYFHHHTIIIHYNILYQRSCISYIMEFLV